MIYRVFIQSKLFLSERSSMQLHKNILVIGSVIALGLTSFSALSWADEKGRALAQAVYDRPDGDDNVTQFKMVLVREGSQPKERIFYTYAKEFPNNVVKSLVRFTVPVVVENTGMLTVSQSDGTNDQWLYLPAFQSIRRIAGERKGGRFVSSDVYFEDLQDRKVNQDTHTYLGKEKYDGVLCDKLESIPTDPSNSSYTKKITWVHPETLIPVRVDFYRGKDTPMKRQIVKRIDNVQGFWTVMETKIEDLETGHETHLRAEKVKYDVGVPDSLFSQNVLQTPSKEIPYRP